MRLKMGGTSIRDEQRSGLPSTAVTDEKVSRANAIIHENGAFLYNGQGIGCQYRIRSYYCHGGCQVLKVMCMVGA